MAVLGTGGGARAPIAKLAELGHEVHVGTRDPRATLARTEPDIQRALPRTKVVKAFVTQEQDTVVDPKAIGAGDHTMFIAGEHTDAKAAVTDLLMAYGWTDILDLGPLVSARGMEMYAHMHSAIGFALGFGTHFGIKVVR
ncbi:hypothetical protein [Streptomyces shaanxiensis]